MKSACGPLDGAASTAAYLALCSVGSQSAMMAQRRLTNSGVALPISNNWVLDQELANKRKVRPSCRQAASEFSLRSIWFLDNVEGHASAQLHSTRSLLKNYCKTCFGYKSGDALGSPDYYKSILGHSGATCFSASGHQTPFSTNS